MSSRASASSKSRNSSLKPYFSDDAAKQIYKYLYYSNYHFSPDIEYPEIYMVNLFCLFKISEILKYKIDKYKKKNSPRMSFSKKSGVYNISGTKKRNNNNNNLEKNRLINSIYKIIDFINSLINNQDMPDFNLNASGITKQIQLLLLNPKLFNQKAFGKIDFKLEYNPENTNIPTNKKKEFKDIIIEDEAFQFDIIEKLQKNIEEKKSLMKQKNNNQKKLNKLKKEANVIDEERKLFERFKKLKGTMSEEELRKRFEELKGPTMSEEELRKRFEELKGPTMSEEELRQRFEELKKK
jgi:hypothetical protein